MPAPSGCDMYSRSRRRQPLSDAYEKVFFQEFVRHPRSPFSRINERMQAQPRSPRTLSPSNVPKYTKLFLGGQFFILNSGVEPVCLKRHAPANLLTEQLCHTRPHLLSPNSGRSSSSSIHLSPRLEELAKPRLAKPKPPYRQRHKSNAEILNYSNSAPELWSRSKELWSRSERWLVADLRKAQEEVAQLQQAEAQRRADKGIRSQVEIEVQRKSQEALTGFEAHADEQKSQLEARWKHRKEKLQDKAEIEVPLLAELEVQAEPEEQVKANEEISLQVELDGQQNVHEHMACLLAEVDAPREIWEDPCLQSQMQARPNLKQEMAWVGGDLAAQEKTHMEAALPAGLEGQQKATQERVHLKADAEEQRKQDKDICQDICLQREAEVQQKFEHETSQVPAKVEAWQQASDALCFQTQLEAQRKATQAPTPLQAEVEAWEEAEMEARLQVELEARQKDTTRPEAAWFWATSEAQGKTEMEARLLAEVEAQTKAKEEASRVQAEVQARQKIEMEVRMGAEREVGIQGKLEAQQQAKQEEEVWLQAEDEAWAACLQAEATHGDENRVVPGTTNAWWESDSQSSDESSSDEDTDSSMIGKGLSREGPYVSTAEKADESDDEELEYFADDFSSESSGDMRSDVRSELRAPPTH